MSAAVKAGVILAVVVALFTIVFIAVGLHESPLVGSLVFIGAAIVANAAIVFWGLRQTASENPYGGQLLAALVIGIVGGVLVFSSSMLIQTVLFPGSLDESKAAAIDWLDASGLPEDQLEVQIQAVEGRTAVQGATSGGIATVITSLVVGAIVAIFVRRK